MSTTTDIIRTAVIVGSTRPGRRAPAIAKWLIDGASPALEMELIDLVDVDLPILSEPMPAAFGRYEQPATRRFSELIDGFDAFVLVTPEYNHSTSAVLKNALDHLHAEWRDKPVAFVGYGLDGGTRAVEHLRTICAELGMAGVGPQVTLDLREEFGPDGSVSPRERTLRARERLLETLTRWAAAFRTLGSASAPSVDGRPVLEVAGWEARARAAAESFVAGIQAGLDASDAEAYDAQFAADVLWGSPRGRTLAGFERVAEAHRSLMSRRIGANSRYELVHALAPAPGIALAHVRRRSLSGDVDAFSEMALYVLVQRADRWWLAAGQNTPITDPTG
jgi:uncharacterized protein (TIGR02246 family)